MRTAKRRPGRPPARQPAAHEGPGVARRGSAEPARIPKARVKKNTLRDSVYGALKAMIITGQLPPGARVTENELAAKLNVSRTPVREALNRIERDGLVTGRPRQGYAVKEFDIKMFREAFEVRELLDGYASELATAKITPAGRQRLRGMVRECERLAALDGRSREDLFQELQIGMDIHRAIAEISGNEMLCGLLNGILDKCQHFVWMELLWLDEWRVAREEHAGIVEAICQGDAPRASALARHHIRESRANILKLLQAKSDYQAFLARAS
ncbi:MAG TPA: GntR family transcriptional regulator [Dongiaceae bacterium]|nr:GntR family transcriptional regulator [Dongiaceae bacterium]